MANIAIVNFCNLKCQYCFADDMLQEKASVMSLDDYRKILHFLERTPKNHVGIIGGEPTLHPHFGDILKETNLYCRGLDTGATLFTNGIELDKWLPNIGERIGLLINVSSPEYQTTEATKKQMDCLDHLYELSWFDQRANIGCNIHYDCKDYSFIWELVDKYKLHHVRTSVVSPAACYEKYRGNKEEYYQMMKPIYLKYAEDAIKHNCRINMDCGHIPFCYFNSDEREMLDSITDGLYNEWCEPVVDITSDFKATACFGSYDPVDIRDFENLLELERYLQIKKSLPKSEKLCVGRCTTCKRHEKLQCQGGCLGFADGME